MAVLMEKNDFDTWETRSDWEQLRGKDRADWKIYRFAKTQDQGGIPPILLVLLKSTPFCGDALAAIPLLQERDWLHEEHTVMDAKYKSRWGHVFTPATH